MVKYRLTRKGKLVAILLCSFILLFVTLGVSLSKEYTNQEDYSSLNSAQDKTHNNLKPQPEPQAPVSLQKDQHNASAELEKLKISIFFDANATLINDKYDSDLESFIEAALQYQDAGIQVEGNCATLLRSNQSKAQKQANYNLSLMRAQTVADFIKDKGINPDRLIVISNGSDKPLKDNDTPAGREFNRRVDVFFVNK